MSARLINVRAGIMTPTVAQHVEFIDCDLGYCEVDKLLDYVLFDRCRIQSITGGTGCDSLVIRDCTVMNQLQSLVRNVRVENCDIFCDDINNFAMGSIEGSGQIIWGGCRFHHNGDDINPQALVHSGTASTFTVAAVPPKKNVIEVALDRPREPMATLQIGALLYTGSIGDTKTSIQPNRGVVREIYSGWGSYILLDYKSATGDFTIGKIVTGASSNATGTTLSITKKDQTNGTLVAALHGKKSFADGEVISDGLSGNAKVGATVPTESVRIEAEFDTEPSVFDRFSWRGPQLLSIRDCIEIDRNNVAKSISQVPPVEQGQMVRNNVTDNGVKQMRINLPSLSRPTVIVPIQGDVLSITCHVASAAVAPGVSAKLQLDPSWHPPQAWLLDLTSVGTRKIDVFGQYPAGGVGADQLPNGFTDTVSGQFSAEFWRLVNLIILKPESITTPATGWIVFEVAEHF